MDKDVLVFDLFMNADEVQDNEFFCFIEQLFDKFDMLDGGDFDEE